MPVSGNAASGRKTKVFHIITKLELGGAQKVTLMTLGLLPQDRYEPGLVSAPQGLLREKAESIPGVRCLWISSLVREVRPIKDFTSFVQLWRLFRRERPDIVHTHSSKAGILGRWAAWLAGVPIVFHTAHGFGFNAYQQAAVRRFCIWLERWTRRITTRLVAVSEANVRTARENCILKSDNWVLCRDAISVADFLKPDLRRGKLASWGIPENKVIVGMVACFKPQKCPGDFIAVAARVLESSETVHFVMAGDGELRAEVEATIEKHGIGDHITLLGWQDDMPEVYRNIDIVVLTSLWEGLPCVFSEAMATGLPVVATDVDGAREAIIHGETGYLHERHDIAGLARSVALLAEDRELRESMGAAGKSRVAEFDIEASVSTLEAAYRECLEEARD